MNTQKSVLFTVFVEVQPRYVKEFNDWYNLIHVPEVMSCPGFLSGVRYEESGITGRFMAMYELSGTAALESEEFAKARGWKQMEWVVNEFSNALWEHIYTVPAWKGANRECKPTVLCFNRASTHAEHDAEFNRWYDEEHLTELLDCPGWLGASRYKALRGDYQYLTIYDLSGTSAFESPGYLKHQGFRQMERFVTASSTVAYRPIFTYGE